MNVSLYEISADFLKALDGLEAVSYTHLDVYKRQILQKVPHHTLTCSVCL